MTRSPSQHRGKQEEVGASTGPSGVLVDFPAGADRQVTPARLGALFAAHQRPLMRFLALRLGSAAEAQDAAQTVMLRLLQRGAALRGSDEELRALLYVTARNIAIDRLRERARRGPDLTEEAALQLADEAASPERAAQARQQLELVHRLLEELPPKCRFAFTRYALEQRGYDEVAAEMGVTASMVRKYVLRALAHCAQRFNRLDGWE
jgi:RNA polymerase sigma-70 factor (ECF subfamily)